MRRLTLPNRGATHRRRGGRPGVAGPGIGAAGFKERRISGASGITADRHGNVYAADVGPQRIRKYVKQ